MFLGFFHEFFKQLELLNSLRSCVRFVEEYIYVNFIFVHMFTLLSTNIGKTPCHKMTSPKKLTLKGTLRQLFIRIYRLERQSVMLVFSTQLWELLLNKADFHIGFFYLFYTMLSAKGDRTSLQNYERAFLFLWSGNWKRRWKGFWVTVLFG